MDSFSIKSFANSLFVNELQLLKKIVRELALIVEFLVNDVMKNYDFSSIYHLKLDHSQTFWSAVVIYYVIRITMNYLWATLFHQIVRKQ